jgi:hypothetical protein
LVITANCGGSNPAKVRLWKRELQRFANETGLSITATHPSQEKNWILFVRSWPHPNSIIPGGLLAATGQAVGRPWRGSSGLKVASFETRPPDRR